MHQQIHFFYDMHNRAVMCKICFHETNNMKLLQSDIMKTLSQGINPFILYRIVEKKKNL